MSINKNNTMTAKALCISICLSSSLCAMQENKENDRNQGNILSTPYATIAKMVTDKDFNIHQLNNNKRTPLADYIFNEKSPTLNVDILHLFFDHKAQILSPEPESCNSLYAILTRPDCWSTHDKTIAIATLFKERLAPLKGVYNDRLFCFYGLNKVRGKKKLALIPKPLIFLITSLSMQGENALLDIKNSLHCKHTIPQLVSCFAPYTAWFDSYDYHGVLCYKKVYKETSGSQEIMNRAVSQSKELLSLLAPSFWDRPVKECLQDLDTIIMLCAKKKTMKD